MARTIATLQHRKVTLDARADRLDVRDRPYTPRVTNLPPEFPERKKMKEFLPDYLDEAAGRILDQGQEGACTGFGMAATINYLFWARGDKGVNVSPRMLYHLAKFYDEWPGEDYSGSSCRGALKGWHKHGVCQRTLWPYTVNPKNGTVPAFEDPLNGWDADAVQRPLGVYYRIDKNSVVDMQAALAEIGAIYCSGDVHDGWTLPPHNQDFSDYSSLPVIRYISKTKVSGGHAFALVGYTSQGFVVQNSWGRGWGLSGFALLTYDDWVANGTDAWTVSLGVPIKRGSGANLMSSPRAFAAGAGGLAAHLSGAGSTLPDTPTSKPYWNPLDEASARERMVVMGNNGMPINRLVECADAGAAIARAVRENALKFFAQHPVANTNRVKRFALYVHGGLNSEEDSVVRTRLLAPYFEANGIYPLFLTWKTGAGESIRGILDDHAKEIGADQPFSAGWLDKLKEQATDTWDRGIEILAQTLGAKSIWSEMKQNAMLGGEADNALAMTATAIAGLRKAVEAGNNQFELHLIGHSAGSIVLGHLLDLFAAGTPNQAIASCSLFAPACTVAFANAHYIPAVNHSQILPRQAFHIDTLSDNRERDDTVGPYRKSLLYLVSRALEDQHKMPLLGLLKAFDPACNTDEHWNEPRLAQMQAALTTWQQFWWAGQLPVKAFSQTGNGRPASLLNVTDARQIESGARKIETAHGSFDNDVAVIRAALARVLGVPAVLPASASWNLDY